jgi:integrase
MVVVLMQDQIQQQIKGIYRMTGSQNWWFRYTRDGRQYRVTLRTPDLAEAIIRGRAILAEGLIASEVYVPNESAPRRREIHDLIDLYLEEGQNRLKDSLRKVTADSRRYILKKFVADSAISTAVEITGSKINQWLIGLKREGKSKSTLWTYGERVRNFVKFLMPKYAPSTALNGFTMPDQPTNGRQNFVYKDEVTKILDAASDPDLKFVLFCGFDAGLRRNEISEAKVDWFDLERRVIYVREHENFVPKNRKNRPIPLTDRFADFLQSFLAGRKKNEYVLAPQKTVKGANKYRYDTNKRVRSHFERCQANSTMHDMRRSFASNRAGLVDIYQIAVWLGDGLRVVERSYGHLTPQSKEINKGV